VLHQGQQGLIASDHDIGLKDQIEFGLLMDMTSFQNLGLRFMGLLMAILGLL
jgi:hypothetical protein